MRYGGPDASPVTTDGPLPETSDLVAGWYMIDVESYERAVELAAYVSSEPGPGGEPLYEWIDVREVMSEAPSDDWPGGAVVPLPCERMAIRRMDHVGIVVGADPGRPWIRKLPAPSCMVSKHTDQFGRSICLRP